MENQSGLCRAGRASGVRRSGKSRPAPDLFFSERVHSLTQAIKYSHASCRNFPSKDTHTMVSCGGGVIKHGQADIWLETMVYKQRFLGRPMFRRANK